MPNHYDTCREGYCPGCGASPGNIVNGVCGICNPIKMKPMKMGIPGGKPIVNRLASWIGGDGKQYSTDDYDVIKKRLKSGRDEWIKAPPATMVKQALNELLCERLIMYGVQSKSKKRKKKS